VGRSSTPTTSSKALPYDIFDVLDFPHSSVLKCSLLTAAASLLLHNGVFTGSYYMKIYYYWFFWIGILLAFSICIGLWKTCPSFSKQYSSKVFDLVCMNCKFILYNDVLHNFPLGTTWEYLNNVFRQRYILKYCIEKDACHPFRSLSWKKRCHVRKITWLIASPDKNPEFLFFNVEWTVAVHNSNSLTFIFMGGNQLGLIVFFPYQIFFELLNRIK
jgi:hypothetical protein